MISDICSTPGKGTIVGPEQIREAVFARGFNPFALGLSSSTAIARQYGPRAYEHWKTNIVAPDTTNWNVCPRCYGHLKQYMSGPARADGFEGTQYHDSAYAAQAREEVERHYLDKKKSKSLLDRLFKR